MQVLDNASHRNEYLFLRTLRDNFYFSMWLNPLDRVDQILHNSLDLVITNDQFISDIDYIISPLGKSDHCTLSFDGLLEANTS